MRWASKPTAARLRQAATTSGPNVRLGTNSPSMTSHWMRSTPAFSRAAHSSPSRAKSAGSTEGAIWIGRPVIASTLPASLLRQRCEVGGVEVLVDAADLAVAVHQHDEAAGDIEGRTGCRCAPQHVLLHEAAVDLVTLDLFVAEVAHVARHPREDRQVGFPRLGNAVEVVPDH